MKLDFKKMDTQKLAKLAIALIIGLILLSFFWKFLLLVALGYGVYFWYKNPEKVSKILSVLKSKKR